MPRVSVIVPVYNVEHYLDDCLTSILLQEFVDFECILVNDGSTDNSASICEKYQKKDSRFRLLNQTNSGATMARFNGVKSAIGEWIMFVDSDDTLKSDALSLLINESEDCDIIIGHTKLFPEAYKWPFTPTNAKYSKFIYLKHLITNKIHGGPCARVIKKELFNDFVYNIPSTVVLGEDFIMNIRLCLDLVCAKTIEQVVYIYRYVEHDYNRDFFSLFQRMVVELRSVAVQKISTFQKMQLSFLTIVVFFRRCLKSTIKRFF